MRHMQRPDCMLHTSWYVSASQLWQGMLLFKGALEGAPIPHLTDISCTRAWKAMYFLLVLGAQWQPKCIGLHLLSLRKNSSQERTAAGTTHAACTKSVFHSYSSHVTPKHFQSTQKKRHILNAIVLSPWSTAQKKHWMEINRSYVIEKKYTSI